MTSYTASAGGTRRAAQAAPDEATRRRQKEAVAGDLEDVPPAEGWSTVKLLTVLCAMLGGAIVAAFLVIGLLVVKNGDQHTRIDNLGNRTVQQQEEINRLDVRVMHLEEQGSR